ncbi:PEP/pyruvate-binding domain-containing protein [Melittangium boletus]|uniref:Phosphoenolpyruvate synthase n=1 Tax=Melittangium boletus DSM 14713 TaxID=1294270 RepID=A0A250IFA7_9BACT|nr:PEP/pyruvate-binding domain-containing protein [Melittangium boletus]ATB29910.1 phosphoenolpyruvate synthase [Melittangium boletus DSM 14713]
MSGPSPVCSFEALSPEHSALAGGKGRTLARLFQAGLPVPEGFVVLVSAFEGDSLRETAWERVKAELARLGAGHALAVRSSALGEDSARDSFAGEFETRLDVRGEQAVRDAIEAVRRSRHAARVSDYSRARGLSAEHEVAVVVQRMVSPDFSGVLFTADPVTGSRSTIVGNAVPGLGERLVSGEETGLAFTLGRLGGGYSGPPELRRFARAFRQLAERLEREFGVPQDLEWALVRGRVVLLQARPITTLRGHDPTTGEHNDSLTSDCLWTSTNLGEAVPGVMTPCTWSLVRIFIAETLPTLFITDFPPIGNIGGRFYMNLSLTATIGRAFGMSAQRLAKMSEETFGTLPEGMEVPLLPLGRWRVLRALLPGVLRLKPRIRAHLARLPAFVAAAPARCEALRARIKATDRAPELIALWEREVLPYVQECCRMLEAGARHKGRELNTARARLREWVGDADANALLSGVEGGAHALASLETLVGLARLARGELDRETYARRYGHRGPHEFEVSLPRPAEEPAWLDRQLARARETPVDVDTLLARQKEARAAAWERFQARHPSRVKALRHQLEEVAEGLQAREAARSEVVRVFWVLRVFVLRAGALLGLGPEVFFLEIDELLGVLRGDTAPLPFLSARQATHARYAALPVYPTLIRGRFDPFQWAADPRRRADVFNARGEPPADSEHVTGFPGAAGIVEGRVRVLTSPDDAEELQVGEVLVTSVTNVGWTPLFPRAAAIVTDVGAPLSHAAIVARELGIPAVVGCGNATMRLRTGDRVRVNGAQGRVELLPPTASA